MQSGSITRIQPDQENSLLATSTWTYTMLGCVYAKYIHGTVYVYICTIPLEKLSWCIIDRLIVLMFVWIHQSKFSYKMMVIKFWIAGCVSYLNVVRRTWGEVSEQGLRYVQVLGHLCEGGIGVRTHLLVPTGRGPTFRSSFPNSHYTFMDSVGLEEWVDMQVEIFLLNCTKICL